MELWSQLDFDKLDLDGDGVVSKEELATALACPAGLYSFRMLNVILMMMLREKSRQCARIGIPWVKPRTHLLRCPLKVPSSRSQ